MNERSGFVITLNKIINFSIYFFSTLIFLSALAFFFWQYYLSKGEISFSVDAPGEAMSGEKITLNLNYNNQSKRTLYDAYILLELPENSFSADWQPLKTIKIPLGDIEEEKSGQEYAQLRIVGEEQENKNISAYLFWKSSGFKVSFKKEKIVNITLTQPIVSLDLLTPRKILPQTPFETKIVLQNNLGQEIRNLQLKITPPKEYQLQESQPRIDDLEEVSFKKLLPKERKEISLKGKIKGEVYQVYPFLVEVNLSRGGEIISLQRKEGKIPLSPSPLPIDISLSEGDKTLHLGDEVSYLVSYQNKTDVALKDVIIKVYLDTENTDLLDFSSLSTDGFFDLETKTITWNAGNHPSLEILDYNQKDSVSFTVKLKEEFSLRKLKNSPKKNFVLKMRAEIETPTVPYNIQAEKLTNFSETENKVADKINFACQVFFRDAKSGFLNKGPFPLKVGKTTQFTVHFIVKNYANDLENAKISAKLSDGTRWLNKFKNESWPDFEYQERTSKIYWQKEKIDAWQGIFDEPVHLIAQIAFTPQPYHRGKSPSFLEDIHLRAKDSFTGEIYDLRCQDLGLFNLRLFDKTILSDQDKVQ